MNAPTYQGASQLLQHLATANQEQLQAQLLDLFCQLAYQEGDFTLSSGQRSSYYINGKQVTLHPVGALVVGRLLFSMLPPQTQAVAGLTLGADPLVSSVSVISALENQPIPGLIVRKEPKGHGTQAYIEGPSLETGSSVVVLEDVVTTGSSALKAAQRLRDAGYRVSHVLALVDREQGGSELYPQHGLSFSAALTLSQIQQRSQTNLQSNNS
ncbi:orotate phosphoribosyltransferase [Geitlerinema sp. PCC 9228]|uniref:orotate phosphoribosyltransferase n=1 Tax=Geitlerinema sp. PCC 9228 TaxID=111611 RepID=UPI0008F9CB79|nr:orotate phosphoribosyltransferase [Geitlerinema sp. PCC 9228]